MSEPDLLSRLTAALTGRYAVQRELGRGGMATVFLAQDEKHDRPVAIKVLSPELAAALGSERFLREIALTARLDHPHILGLLDSGEADGLLFYAMPYVEGESLRDRLSREKQLPLEDALQISREVADALAYAHSRGVIHRDIKPENILLSAGHARVADFGIARAVHEAGGETLTATGMAIGTPAYMSPEQAAGSKELDGRSDLYSLGCVLYEMLAGQPPFTGPTVESVVHQHLTAEAPNVTQVRHAVPERVATALRRAMAKTPADRFGTAMLFREAMAPSTTAAEGALEARPARSRRRGRKALVVVAGVLLLVAAGVVGRRLLPKAHAARFPRSAIAVLPFQNLSAQGPYASFAGGLHEELLTQLAKVAAVKVISGTSVRQYATTTKPLPQIADELHVGTIVEGSVQVLGNRLRVNVQISDPVTDEQLWAQQYDRTLEDAFAVQSDIAQHIVGAVSATFTGAEATAIAAAPTENPEAYRLYLEGEGYRQRPGQYRGNLERAERLYEQAIALDSTFALAHASLSVVDGTLYGYGLDRSAARARRQRREAEAALRFGPELPEARWAMGMVHYEAEGDFAEALPDLMAAVHALPGSAELWSYVGYAERRLGHWDRAVAAFEKAAALNPRDAQIFMDLGGITFLLMHRYREAIAAYNDVLQVVPDMPLAELARAYGYVLWQGRLDSLRAILARGPEHYGATGTARWWRARLGLWSRVPQAALSALGNADSVVFDMENYYQPGLLYAAWAEQERGDSATAARAFAGALRRLDTALAASPNDWRMHASRGLALAGLGRTRAAKREADWLLHSDRYRGDLVLRPFIAEQRAMILAQLGLAQEAVSELRPLLTEPSWTSAAMVRLDPRYDPIRKDPRFQAMLAEQTSSSR